MDYENVSPSPADGSAVDRVAEAGDTEPIAPLADFEAAIMGQSQAVVAAEVVVGEACGCGFVLAGGSHRPGADCLVELRRQVLSIVECIQRAESRDDLRSMLLQCGFLLK